MAFGIINLLTYSSEPKVCLSIRPFVDPSICLSIFWQNIKGQSLTPTVVGGWRPFHLIQVIAVLICNRNSCSVQNISKRQTWAGVSHLVKVTEKENCKHSFRRKKASEDATVIADEVTRWYTLTIRFSGSFALPLPLPVMVCSAEVCCGSNTVSAVYCESDLM